MNRTIKFRAWDSGNKKWVYGWLTKLTEGVRRFWAIIQDEDGELVRYYIHEEKSIGQFTGLYDKNGKEIYEGDILQHDNFANTRQKVVGVMEWDAKNACFSQFYPLFKFEIIGNIYETPELIKAQEVSKCK